MKLLKRTRTTASSLAGYEDYAFAVWDDGRPFSWTPDPKLALRLLPKIEAAVRDWYDKNPPDGKVEFVEEPTAELETGKAA